MSASYREGESWMGRHVRHHKPRTNLNTVIHSFYPSAPAFLPSAVLMQLKQFPDVSFYQGDINWDVMRSMTDTVVIRAGQNLWPDTKFNHNYTEAKKRGMRRSVYWFYDDRIDPGKQALLQTSLIKDDLPEMKVYVDWERKYGGAFGGLKNVVAFMQAVEASLSIECGFYTGYWFFRENTNPIISAAQYAYLKTRELWEAFYASASQVLVPSPWLVLTHWQYGTPAVGLEYGVETKEIDLNFANMTIAEFEKKYPIAPPDPDPIGETMQGKVLRTTNIRNAAGATATGSDIGDLYEGDIVTWDKAPLIGSVTWYHLTNATRKGEPIITLGGLNVSQRADCYAYGVNIEPIGEPEPTPARTITGATVRFNDGTTQEMIVKP